MSELDLTNKVAYPDQPRMALSVVQNQKLWQWTNNNDFYKLVPSVYYSFYNNWVREWLYWFDGFVPWVHGSDYGLLSTSIGTTIVNRTTDSVFGGNLMFSNARKPIAVVEQNGKKVSKALDFISNEWSKAINLKGLYKRAIRDAYAGGFSLLKVNRGPQGLWVDELRADRFWVDITAQGKIRKCISVLSFYNDMTYGAENEKRYCLIEERRYETRGLFDEEEMPVIEYKMYDSSVQIQYLSVNPDNCVKWDNLTKEVRKAFRSEYDVELNKPKAMNGFESLGVYLVKGSEDVPQVPQVGLGASLLANITTYLYEYDFYNTAFNTDMYLARGRIMVPKAMQDRNARQQGSQPHGFNEFLYTAYESMSIEGNKPEAIQFALRSAEWKEARNMLLECMATSIGISVSTLASYLSDGSNRTAREVSAEESATTLFIENARRRFEVPFNELIKDVLRFYGYVDDVEVRWSRAGMTNQTVLVDTLSRAVHSGLISKKKAHHQFNYDDDEEQNEEDYIAVEKDQAQQQNSLFGGFPGGDMN